MILRLLRQLICPLLLFDSQARQIIPLTELMSFKEPEINAGGATALGGALNVLIDCVNSEVRKSTETQKGDWRPLVFILTDGSPTDVETFREAAQRIKGMKAANIIACAAGSNANTSYLKEITESVLMMNTLSAGDMAQFFAWVSDPSKCPQDIGCQASAPIELPPPPQGFVVVP